ncbi:uncharacterized protein LOC144645453 [Oculina patagonica]
MNDQVEEGKAKAAGVIGILIGICSLIELICGFIYVSKGGPEGSGLWPGFGFAVIAVLGIVTWIKRNKAVMIFYLVMCILWFIVSIVQAFIAYFAWWVWRVISCGFVRDPDAPFIVATCDDTKLIASLFLCIMIASFLAAILTLAGSIIGCMGTCCAGPAQAGVVVVQQPVAGYPMVVQQTAMNQQQAYPGQQPYPGQQLYPGQQPVTMVGTGPPPDYGIPVKE